MENSRTKQSVYNIFIGFLNQFISIVLNFISRTIFINILGVEFLGLNGLFTEILRLLSIADLGINTAMVYSFYKPIADDDTNKISALITFYKKVYNIIAIVVMSIGLAIIPFLDVIVNIDKNIPMLEVYYLFSLLSVVISYLFIYKTSIITADQKNYILVRISIIVNFVKVGMQIIILLIFKNYILYLTINLIANFMNNYLGSKKATELYPFIDEKVELEKKYKIDIFNRIKSIFVYKTSSLLLTATDNTLISSTIGTAVVGFYSNYLLVSNNVISIIQILFSSLTASIGNIIVSEKSKKRYEIFKITQSVSFILCGIIVSSFAVLVNDLVNIWLGPRFLFNYSTVLVISLNMYLSCVLQPLWTYREATGLYTKTKYIMLIAAIINIILSIILGKAIGIDGILLASAISRLTTYFWYEPLLLYKEYFLEPVSKYYIPIGINMIFVTLSIVLLNMIFSKFIIYSWTMLIIKSIVCGMTTLIIFLILYSKSEGIYLINQRIKKFRRNSQYEL